MICEVEDQKILDIVAVRSSNSIIMHFPQLVKLIKGGLRSANCAQPRLSRSSSATTSSARLTEKSTRSLRRRKNEIDVDIGIGTDIDIDTDIGMPSPRRRHRDGSRLPSTAWELQSVFRKFDDNGDRKISWSELGKLMTSMGCPSTDEELRLMISMADSDADGFIDLSDFAVMNTFTVDEERGLDDMESAFGMFDFDGNGLISADELLMVFDCLGETSSLEDCRSMIAGVDSNRDGSVSFDEFLIMMITSST